MNTLQFEVDGLIWKKVANNIFAAMVEPKDFLFIEVTPLGGSYKVKYRNIQIVDYHKDEIKLIRKLYNIGSTAYFTMAFVLGQHYDNYEWEEVCDNYQDLSKLFEEQTSFDVNFLGDVDAAGVPDINKNIFKKVFDKHNV